MSEPFIGEIKIFAGNFPPKNYAFCDGQILPIASNTALFSILGTMFGGNGTTTFGLPNLLGRVPMNLNMDGAPGLSPRAQGETGGALNTTLNRSQLPSHGHQVSALAAAANQTQPNPNSFPGTVPGARGQQGPPIYAAGSTAATPLHPQSLIDVGGNQPIDLTQPYLAVNFIIALYGQYPPRQ